MNNIRINFIWILFHFFICTEMKAQFFEGQLTYNNLYIDYQTMNPLFDGFNEDLYIKDSLLKIDIHNEGSGAIDWEIVDFKKGMIFSRQLFNDAPIYKRLICNSNVKKSTEYVVLDTIFQIGGLKSKVMIELINGKKRREIYYCEDIHLNPCQFKCYNNLDDYYVKTNGSLITKTVNFVDMYIWVNQLIEIKNKKINDSEFLLPEGIKIVDSK